MGMSVINSAAAVATQRTLLRTHENTTRSLERLSSGLRVNRAADDAAGLTIAEGLRSQANGMAVAVRNARDGISLLQVADGALDGSSAILHRMRDLAVQGANDGALDDTARAAVQLEMSELKNQLTLIGRSANFNGTPLLDGRYRGVFQVGAAAGETVMVAIGRPGAGIDTAGLGLDGVDVTGSTTLATTTVPAISDDEGTPTAGRLHFPGDFITPGTLEANYRALAGTVHLEGKTLDLGSIDVSGAVTSSDFLSAVNQAGMAAFGMSYTPFVATASYLQFYGATPGVNSSAAAAVAMTPAYTGQSGASTAISLVDGAIDVVSSLRAELGAISNRFEQTIGRLGIAVSNTTASMARILDADMAEEVMRLSSSQVLAQSGTAMLASVNTSGQHLLRLLN
jgi:flagellin-like hook-associated protein FlgL